MEKKYLNNIEKKYEFSKQDNILVIGNSTIEIIEFLSIRANKIMVLENNPDTYRKLISYVFDCKNVNIVDEKFIDVLWNPKFEYIIFVNYLLESDKLQMIEKVKKCLKENGKILFVDDNTINIKDTEKLEDLSKEIEIKQYILDNKEKLNQDISKQLTDYRTAYKETQKQLNMVQNELNIKQEEVNRLYSSEQYQKGEGALLLEKKYYPFLVTIRGIQNIKNKVFTSTKNFITSIVRKIVKNVYDWYPIKEHKRALKNKLLYSDRLAKLANVKSYKEYCYIENKDKILLENGAEEQTIKCLVNLEKTIGIHLHLYYVDLLEEFYNYLSNIPYVYDLYVSVMEGTDIKPIHKKLNQLINLNKLEIRTTPNSGRDFGPMFVEFKNELINYDYIMHIHSKKSLRMGEDQAGWRHHMLDNLLGSIDRIMKNFYLLERMNMGMVYVDSYESGCPFWGNTWLTEAPVARDILNKLGMKYEEEFLQFPAGSMFIAKKEAIKQLFDLNLTYEDFGKEEGKNDGTLAYVFEKITAKLAMHNGYNLAIYNPSEQRYRENKGEQNFQKEFLSMNRDRVLDILKNFEIITFDIFDTLITRVVYQPDDSFEIIKNKIREQHINLENYFELRKKAETNVRINKNFQGDCNLEEIYEEFKKITNLPDKDIEIIKQAEIETELELVVPRYDMLYIYNKLIESQKKVILISDMYLSKENLSKMLKQCGYDHYYDIMVSSELGVRKDNGTMWNYFFEKYGNYSTVHVGDNEVSDIHALAKIGKCALYVMRGTKLNSLMEYKCVEKDEKLNLLESLVLGSVINGGVSNSPFAMFDSENTSVINSYYNYGYSVLGPIIFNYIRWIVKMAKEEKNGEVLLFSAREGYYLQKIYQLFKDKVSGLSKVDDYYLYVSRRAVTVMNIKTIDDVREIMKKHYQGTLKEVLYYRLNYKENNFIDENINLPEDLDKVMKIVTDNFDIILENAKKEKTNYLEYINHLNIDFENKKVSLLDLGYAGTAQYYLSKLLNQKIDGKYFVVTNHPKPLDIGCDVFSCYNKSIYGENLDKNIMHANSILLEAFLTSPDGQFLYMDIDEDQITPIFTHEFNKKEQIQKLDEVYRGVKEFSERIINLMGDSVLDYEMNREYIYRCYENCLKESYRLNEEIRSLFWVEDNYCSNGMINGIDIFNERRKKYWHEWHHE